MEKYKLTGWQEPYATLKKQLADYDAWVRATVLPKARTDFRLPPEEYALNLESYGIDIPPEQIAAMAHQAFTEIQGEMKGIAAQIAKERNLPSSDYRDVMRELKKQQLVGDAILPFYEDRLKQIEKIIVEQQIVTLPDRPAHIRIATAAETAQQPAPHMAPRRSCTTPDRRAIRSAAEYSRRRRASPHRKSTMTSPSTRRLGRLPRTKRGPDTNCSSTRCWNTEFRWRGSVTHSTAPMSKAGDLYSEYLIKPYMPLEGQLVSLDYRLLRAARAFLDPELQCGKITTADAYRVLQDDVVSSHAFAEEEVERYTYRAPGQANSYFYGYTKLIALREDTEKALSAKGVKFDQKKFHDFILAQGLLPPDLMRKAVMEDFVPAQK